MTRRNSRKNFWFRSVAFIVVLSLIHFQIVQSLLPFASFQNYVYAGAIRAETLEGTNQKIPTVPVSDNTSQDQVPPELVAGKSVRSEEHTSELQSQFHLVCRLLL